MVREVSGTGARLIRGRELAFSKDSDASTLAEMDGGESDQVQTGQAGGRWIWRL